MLNDNYLTPSLEDYLLAVNKLIKEKNDVRLKDISRLIGVSSAFANSAISQLVEKGYLQHAPYGYIEITPLGIAYAEEIYNRRNVITEFFEKFTNVNNAELEKIVCKIEHYLSPFINDFQIILKFFEENIDCYNKIKNFVNSQNNNLNKVKDYRKIINSNFDKGILPLSSAKIGKYKLVYFRGHRIELRLKQMGILPGDEIEVLSNQSGQVLIAKDVLRIGLGRGAAYHIKVKSL